MDNLQNPKIEDLIRLNWSEVIPDLKVRLQKLIEEFGSSANPQSSKLAKLSEQAQANQQQLQKSVDELYELLDYLRVCIKYQGFDLEATRRENEYLRKCLKGYEEGGKQ